MKFFQEEDSHPWWVRVQFESGVEVGVYAGPDDFGFLTENGVRTIRAHDPVVEISWQEAMQCNPYLFVYLDRCHWFKSTPPQGYTAPRLSRYACHRCGVLFLVGERTCLICGKPVRESLPSTIAGEPAPEQAP